MSDDYYKREPAQYLDGSTIFKTKEDEQNEAEVASLISKAWKCDVNPYGCYSPIDFWAVRNGRLVGHLELKSRSNDSKKYKTVFLNARKYFSMFNAQVGMSVPSIYVVRFTNEVRWIPLNEIDAGPDHVTIGGCKRVVKNPDNDIEPVINIPLEAMRIFR